MIQSFKTIFIGIALSSLIIVSPYTAKLDVSKAVPISFSSQQAHALVYPININAVLVFYQVVFGDGEPFYDMTENPSNPLSNNTESAWDEMTWNDQRRSKPNWSDIEMFNDSAWEWYVIYSLNQNFLAYRQDWLKIDNIDSYISSLSDSTVIVGGSTGPQTINKRSGSVNFAANSSSLVVTNNLITSNSIIVATVGTNDASMHSVKAVSANGSFTLYADAPATSETRVHWFLVD